MIFVDAYGLFAEMFKKFFQETLLIPVHALASGNHNAIINEGFRWYLNKVQKINSAYKVILHQWLQGVFSALYAWNAGPVDGTDVYQSVVYIVREFPFPFYLSLSRLREGTSELQQYLDHFEALSPLQFRKYRCLVSWYLIGYSGTVSCTTKAISRGGLTQVTLC